MSVHVKIRYRITGIVRETQENMLRETLLDR
jgi:hypothetical protein